MAMLPVLIGNLGEEYAVPGLVMAEDSLHGEVVDAVNFVAAQHGVPLIGDGAIVERWYGDMSYILVR